ncbi:D5-ATPase-helicase [Cotonvirus japonicus]|uniref:D5-ATPase-helicase n=1 Tax=Cotonvirus japonicus TaxID=2811091 RepID=A0ABM7NR42_9VIRU|nr:D5-ATPase-helicase [Cotonvirus japonicus]BCS82633.1 D5-ATPase-helicase [Cotonvirus japonicus]
MFNPDYDYTKIPTPIEIAKLLFKSYSHKYKCVSIRRNIWCELNNNNWYEIDSAYSLRNLISNEISEKYYDQVKYLNGKIKETDNEYVMDQYHSNIKILSKIINMLNMSFFRNAIIRECANLFYQPN